MTCHLLLSEHPFEAQCSHSRSVTVAAATDGHEGKQQRGSERALAVSLEEANQKCLLVTRLAKSLELCIDLTFTSELLPASGAQDTQSMALRFGESIAVIRGVLDMVWTSSALLPLGHLLLRDQPF